MLNITLPTVAPSSSTYLALLVLEADVAFLFRPPPRGLGPRALCGGASSAWLPSVCQLLSSSSSSEWPDAKLTSIDLRELAGFSVAVDDPCTSPPPGRICCSTDWEKVQEIMASSLLVSKLLVESSPSLTCLLSSSALHILFKLSCRKPRALASSASKVTKFTPYSTMPANKYWGQYWPL